MTLPAWWGVETGGDSIIIKAKKTIAFCCATRKWIETQWKIYFMCCSTHHLILRSSWCFLYAVNRNIARPEKKNAHTREHLESMDIYVQHMATFLDSLSVSHWNISFFHFFFRRVHGRRWITLFASWSWSVWREAAANRERRRMREKSEFTLVWTHMCD